MLDQMPLLIPPPLLNPLLTPFLKCIITVLMFLIWLKLLTIPFIGPLLSGLKKTLTVSSLWLTTSKSRLGRRKYCRRRYLPCGVLARWWKRPYTDRPSFDPEEAFVGPWLCVLGLASDCIICKEAKVSALTNLVLCLQQMLHIRRKHRSLHHAFQTERFYFGDTEWIVGVNVVREIFDGFHPCNVCE